MIPEGEFQDHGGPLKPHRPWWFTVLTVILILPGFAAPWALEAIPNGSLLAVMVRWFPVYLVATAVCAWYSYPQRRPLSWILVGLMVLSSLSLMLV